jgi:hypothetical protein
MARKHRIMGVPPALAVAERVCRACAGVTQGWLWFCSCECGASHGICYECLESAIDLGMVLATVGSIETDMEAGPPIKREIKSYDFRVCPTTKEARTALAMGR